MAKEKNPKIAKVDRVLAQVIGWTANLIGMVRRFPQGRERDQVVFTSRKILRALRGLREENVRPFVKKERGGGESKEKKAEKKKLPRSERLVSKKATAKKKRVSGPKPKSEKEVKKEEKEEKVIFKKEASKVASE